MEAGVYQIYNQATDKRYIGSSINIKNRLKQHLRNLKANKHHNLHLLNAWNKYKDFLIFEPLEYCEPDECLKLELCYIDYYNSADRRFGYNIDKDAASAGKHLSEETKEKIKQKAIGRKWTDAQRANFIKSTTGRTCEKLSITMKQKYKNGEATLPRFTNVTIDKLESWRKHLSEAQTKRYADYSNRPEGFYLKAVFENDIKYYPSMREAARQLNIDKAAITYAFKNTNGYINKIKCCFIRISKNEFLKNKVVGEKSKSK